MKTPPTRVILLTVVLAGTLFDAALYLNHKVDDNAIMLAAKQDACHRLAQSDHCNEPNYAERWYAHSDLARSEPSIGRDGDYVSIGWPDFRVDLRKMSDGRWHPQGFGMQNSD